MKVQLVCMTSVHEAMAASIWEAVQLVLAIPSGQQ